MRKLCSVLLIFMLLSWPALAANTWTLGSQVFRRTVSIDSALDLSSDANSCYGLLIVNTSAGGNLTVTLPAAAPQMSVTVWIQSAHAVTLDPAADETIKYDTGSTCAANETYVSDSAIGSITTIYCIVAGTWQVVGDPKGDWTCT